MNELKIETKEKSYIVNVLRNYSGTGITEITISAKSEEDAEVEAISIAEKMNESSWDDLHEDVVDYEIESIEEEN